MDSFKAGAVLPYGKLRYMVSGRVFRIALDDNHPMVETRATLAHDGYFGGTFDKDAYYDGKGGYAEGYDKLDFYAGLPSRPVCEKTKAAFGNSGAIEWAHARGTAVVGYIGGARFAGDEEKRTLFFDFYDRHWQDYEDYFELMRQAAPHAEKAGVQITMKPHGGISLTTQDLLAADGKVGHPAFGICYDPGNIIYYTKGEMRPETDVAELAPIVSTGLIKDCTVEDGKPDVMVTPGDGLVDFHTVLSGLVGGGFNGPLYVECVGSSDPGDVDRDIAFTLGYVKGILTAL